MNLFSDEWWSWFSEYLNKVDSMLGHHTEEEMDDYEKGYARAVVDLVVAIEEFQKENSK